MKVYRTKENNFRIRAGKNEHVSIKPGPGASVATSGKRGGHTVSGCFAAISLVTILPAPEFCEDFAQYNIDIFCHSTNSSEKASSDIESRVHITFTGYEEILKERHLLEFYVKTMSLERALEMCKIINSKKISSAEKLLREDLKFLDHLGIRLYQQVL